MVGLSVQLSAAGDAVPLMVIALIVGVLGAHWFRRTRPTRGQRGFRPHTSPTKRRSEQPDLTSYRPPHRKALPPAASEKPSFSNRQLRTTHEGSILHEEPIRDRRPSDPV